MCILEGNFRSKMFSLILIIGEFVGLIFLPNLCFLDKSCYTIGKYETTGEPIPSAIYSRVLKMSCA